jgi:hypothetical protein
MMRQRDPVCVHLHVIDHGSADPLAERTLTPGGERRPPEWHILRHNFSGKGLIGLINQIAESASKSKHRRVATSGADRHLDAAPERKADGAPVTGQPETNSRILAMLEMTDRTHSERGEMSALQGAASQDRTDPLPEHGPSAQFAR